MVMEAPPTPQCVGREFVRQYYTLLNKAPAHLHRFYNNNSSFVHGGLDAPNRETKPMVGQRQIHQKIQQLNFRDCHAKISQVDSQATLGDGVVVQVTGELSNGGQPMRRFTQTFVLAAQSPKKYYVHNDIFRYQDMLMSDEDAEHDSGRSEGDEDPEPVELPPQQPPTQAQPYYQPPHPQQLSMISTGPSQMITPTVNGIMHVDELASSLPTIPPAAVPQSPPQSVPQPAVATAQPPVPPQQSPQTLTQPAVEEPQVVSEETAEEVEESADISADAEPVGLQEDPEGQPAQDEKVESTPQESSEEQSNEAVTSEPKTYANLLKGSGGHAATSPTSNTSSKFVPISPPPLHQRVEQTNAVSGPPASSMPSRPGMSRVARGGCNSVRGTSRPFTSDRQGPNRPLHNDDSDIDRRRSGPSGSSSYPDSNQLFLGNLPHSATEDELRKLFAEFGTVVDLRIHSKGTALKGGTGPKVPNYGFITFDDPLAVKLVLERRPILLENNQKLNVEEKKPRRPEPMGGMRSGPGSDSGTMGRPNNGIGSNGGGRPGQSGGPPRGVGSGSRGRGGGGNFSRDGGVGGQGGARGGSVNNSGSRGGFTGRRQ